MTQDPRGGWRVSWREAGRQRTARYDSKAQAKSRAAAIDRDLAARRPLGTGQTVTILDGLSRYLLTRVRATERHRAHFAATITALCEARGWTSWGDLTPAEAATLKPYHARCVRALWRWAAESGQPVDARALVAARPKTIRKPQAPIPPPEAIAAAIAAADAWHLADGTIAHLVATYGHRVQSCLALRVRDWDAAAGLLTLPVKSGDLHRHPVLPATADRLNRCAIDKAPDDFLLIGHKGEPWASGGAFSSWWLRSIVHRDHAAKALAARKARLAGKVATPPPAPPAGLGILDLRRSAISRMLALGLEPKTVASITGHRTVSLLLNTYARTTEARQKNAIQALAGCPEVVQ